MTLKRREKSVGCRQGISVAFPWGVTRDISVVSPFYSIRNNKVPARLYLRTVASPPH
jgi:hypothetical protein